MSHILIRSKLFITFKENVRRFSIKYTKTNEIFRWMHAYMDGCMRGGMDGGMHGWTDGWKKLTNGKQSTDEWQKER